MEKTAQLAELQKEYAGHACDIANKLKWAELQKEFEEAERQISLHTD